MQENVPQMGEIKDPSSSSSFLEVSVKEYQVFKKGLNASELFLRITARLFDIMVNVSAV